MGDISLERIFRNLLMNCTLPLWTYLSQRWACVKGSTASLGDEHILECCGKSVGCETFTEVDSSVMESIISSGAYSSIQKFFCKCQAVVIAGGGRCFLIDHQFFSQIAREVKKWSSSIVSNVLVGSFLEAVDSDKTLRLSVSDALQSVSLKYRLFVQSTKVKGYVV